MKNEEDLIDDLFGRRTWKGYKLTWCDHCDTAIICCSKCHGTSCNCTSCEFCDKDFEEFCKLKTTKDEYLTEQERDVLIKGKRLQKFILECLENGYTEINWKFLHDKGSLCLYDHFLFIEELKDFREEAIKTHMGYGMPESTVDDLKKKLETTMVSIPSDEKITKMIESITPENSGGEMPPHSGVGNEVW